MAEIEKNDFQRYLRQMMIEGWGDEGQRKLSESVVFIAGAGGLASPAAMYLAAAGVGTLRICDFDVIEMTNLNRQLLHNPGRIGQLKAFSARLTLEKLNELVKIEPIEEKISDENVERLVGDANIIVDCMDNFPTRYSLMNAAAAKGIPLVHGSVWGMEGRLAFIHAPQTPCLKCIFPEAPPKEVFPVLGATPGVIGCLQAMEVLKYLTGVGQTLKGRLLVWDGMNTEFRKFRLNSNPSCPLCGHGGEAMHRGSLGKD